MKKLFFPAVAALALGLASCSSDNVGPSDGGQPSFAEGGYAKVAIALPTQNGDSRAVTDGDQGKFDDGLASEYKVKNAKLVLFQGSDEAHAKFHSAYDLNVSMDGYNDTPNQITSTTRIVKRVNDGPSLTGSHLYALVVLNDNNLLNIGSDGTTLTVNGTDMNGKGLSDLQSLVVEDTQSNFHGNGILMTNAPLATVMGGSTAPTGNIETLADFTNAVYKTEAEAQSKPATDVYVERAVAKVTFTQSNAPKFTDADGNTSDVHFEGTTAPVKWKVVGWDLDVTNKKSFFVRNTTNGLAGYWNSLKSENVNNYRFVGTNSVKDEKYYRTYWAKDPNYDSYRDEFNTLATNETNLNDKFGEDFPQYCFENTFDVANQNKNQTTRVVVKVKVGEGTTFYTFNNDKSRLYTQDKRDARVKAAILAMPEVEQWVRNNGGYDEANATSRIDFSFDSRSTTDGTILLKNEFKVTTNTGDERTYDLTDFAGATTMNEALGLGNVVEYADGYAYYPIRIKHFGNSLTPWNTETGAPTTDKPTANNIYPNNDANNYLGRYGVLRNNWYDLKVNSISGLGDAMIPTVDATPDDDLYNYIAVRINILSWAKRQQSADL